MTQSVAGLSDAELRELAGTVLSELRTRTAGPDSQGFSYRHLVSDLQRRLADAHAYAQSGFGKRERSRPALTTGSRPVSTSTPLSEENKAKLLLGLLAELLPDANAATATADQPSAPPAGAAFEAEIWQALQTGVGRSPAPPPGTPRR